MKAIVFERFGEPAEVLKARDVPTPVPGPGQVRVRMIASPVNPSDLLVTRGRYGVLPDLPSTPGFEGVGRVDQAGPGLLGSFLVGRRVAVANQNGGNWAEYAVIPAVRAIPVPGDLDDAMVASFIVNPFTVLAMVRHVLRVRRGAWLLQTAAGSTLGKMIIALGQHDGFRTLNVVRRREAIGELLELGADAVISTEDGPIAEQVKAIVGAEGVRYALDPVGGDTGTGAFEALAADARMLVYGTLTGEPIRLDPRRLISGRRVLEGFWLGHWLARRNILQRLTLVRQTVALFREGVFRAEVTATYPLDRIGEAVRQAETVGRGGKVLLTMGA